MVNEKSHIRDSRQRTPTDSKDDRNDSDDVLEPFLEKIGSRRVLD